MPFDYTEIAEVASTLIQQFGREVTLRRLDQLPGDSAKPWAGPADVSANYDATDTVSAVFVPPSSASELGLSAEVTDLLPTTREIAIVEPGSFDFATATEMLDNGQDKQISFVETLRPAGVVLLYYIGVKR